MWTKIVEMLKFSSENGWYLPSAFDNRSGKGSVSLLFAHVANFTAIAGIALLLYKDTKTGVLGAIIYSTLMLAFYLIRSLSKFKVDVDDGQIELDSEPEKKDENAQ
jgi:hypothetical protein